MAFPLPPMGPSGPSDVVKLAKALYARQKPESAHTKGTYTYAQFYAKKLRAAGMPLKTADSLAENNRLKNQGH